MEHIMIIGYARVSTKEQDNLRQELSIHEYLDSQNLILDKMVRESISTRKNLEDRKISAAIQELINNQDETKIIVVDELSRVARDQDETGHISYMCRRNGISIITINDLSQTIGAKAKTEDKLLMNVKAYQAEQERENTSRRIKLGLKTAKANGVKLGAPSPKRAILEDNKETILNYVKRKRKTRQEIADQYGLSVMQLHRVLKDWGYKKRKKRVTK